MGSTPLFLNHTFDKNRLKSFISWSLLSMGERETIEMVERLKSTGFGFATQAGISLGVDDLKVPPEKLSLVSQARQQVHSSLQAHQRGDLTALERLQQLVDTWHRTSETLKQTVVNHFQSTDRLSPVYMMAFSGARGNISQVRQLAGMRGLMADPQGQIIGFPIRSNFREGLTVIEYMISCYGARKGLVDTALRTADAGYLTRRLVDVSQHMVIRATTCATPRGIAIKDVEASGKIILPLRDRLMGRVLAEDVMATDGIASMHPKLVGSNAMTGEPPLNHALSSPPPATNHSALTQQNHGSSPPSPPPPGLATLPRIRHQTGKGLHRPRLIASRNQEISGELAGTIASHRDRVLVRSPLACAVPHGVCQLCYGWSLSEGRLVTLGEAVGVIAAQSIGEPGTQLTMRTFHTGGVFSGEVMSEVRAPHEGVVRFPAPMPGLLVRTAHGTIAFLTRASGMLVLSDGPCTSSTGRGVGASATPPSKGVDQKGLETRLSIEAATALFVRQGQRVAQAQLLGEFSSMGAGMNETIEAQRTLFSEISGQISFVSLLLGTRPGEDGGLLQISKSLGLIWILAGERPSIGPLLLPYSRGSHLVDKGSAMGRVVGKAGMQAEGLNAVPGGWGRGLRQGNSPRIRLNSPGDPRLGHRVHKANGSTDCDPSGHQGGNQTRWHRANPLTAVASWPCPGGHGPRWKTPGEQARGLLDDPQRLEITVPGLAIAAKSLRLLPAWGYQVVPSSRGMDDLLWPSEGPLVGWTQLRASAPRLSPIASPLKARGRQRPTSIHPQALVGNGAPARASTATPSQGDGRRSTGQPGVALQRNAQPTTYDSSQRPWLWWFPRSCRTGRNGVVWIDSRFADRHFIYGELFWVAKQSADRSRTKPLLGERKGQPLGRSTGPAHHLAQGRFPAIGGSRLMPWVDRRLQVMVRPPLAIRKEVERFEAPSSSAGLAGHPRPLRGRSYHIQGVNQPLRSTLYPQIVAGNGATGLNRCFVSIGAARHWNNWGARARRGQALSGPVPLLPAVESQRNPLALSMWCTSTHPRSLCSQEGGEGIHAPSLLSDEMRLSPRGPVLVDPSLYHVTGQLFPTQKLQKGQLRANTQLEQTDWCNPSPSISPDGCRPPAHGSGPGGRPSVTPLPWPLYLSPGERSWFYSPLQQAGLPICHELLNPCGVIGLDDLLLEGCPTYIETTVGRPLGYWVADTHLLVALKVGLIGRQGETVCHTPPRASGNGPGKEIGRISWFRKITVAPAPCRAREDAGQGTTAEASAPSAMGMPTKAWGSGASGAPVWNGAGVMSHGRVLAGGASHLSSASSQVAASPRGDLGARHKSVQEGQELPRPQARGLLLFLRKMLLLSQAAYLRCNVGFEPLAARRFLAIGEGGKGSLLAMESLGGNAVAAPIQSGGKMMSTGWDYWSHPRIWRNLVNDNAFLWLRVFPIEVESLTNPTPRYTPGGWGRGMPDRPSSGIGGATPPLPSVGLEANRLGDGRVPLGGVAVTGHPLQSNTTPLGRHHRGMPQATTAHPLVKQRLKRHFAMGWPSCFNLFVHLRRASPHRLPPVREGHELPSHQLRAAFEGGHPAPLAATPSLGCIGRHRPKVNGGPLLRGLVGRVEWAVGQRAGWPGPFLPEMRQLATKLVQPLPGAGFRLARLSSFEGFQTMSVAMPLHLVRFAVYQSTPLGQEPIAGLVQWLAAAATLPPTPLLWRTAEGRGAGSRPLVSDNALQGRSLPEARPPHGDQGSLARGTNAGPRIVPLYRLPGCRREGWEEGDGMCRGGGSTASLWGSWPASGDHAPKPLASTTTGEMVSSLGDDLGAGPSWRPRMLVAPPTQDRVILRDGDCVTLATSRSCCPSSVTRFLALGEEIAPGKAVPIPGQTIAIERDRVTLRRTQSLLFYAHGAMHVADREWVERGAPILTLTYQKLVTGDIVQGIPKIEQFFEAPATREGEPLASSLQARVRRGFERLKRTRPLPQAVRASIEEIQEVVVEGILKVYLAQGVRIADKHLEIVVRQMTSKGQILEAGDTGLFQGEFVDLGRIERLNLSTYGQRADYEPVVLGITRASLDSDSFISAASFQETTRVLSRDTIVGKTDFLRGLKERVVLGDLIQAGTGLDDNINYGLLFGITRTEQTSLDSGNPS